MKIVIIITMALLLNLPLHAQDFWTQTQGPYGGEISSIIEDNSGNLYAVGRWCIYHSTNKGNTWNHINLYESVRSIAVANNVIYIGTNSYGIFKSTNGGIDWTNFSSGLLNPGINDLYISKEGKFYAATWDGIYSLSNDQWIETSTGLLSRQIRFVKGDYDGNTFAVALNNGGIYRSTNNGQLWQTKNNGLASLNIASFFADSNGTIFIGTSTGIYKSTNKGDVWEEQINELSNKHVNSIIRAKDGTLFATAAGYGLYYSANNGNTWQHISSVTDPLLLTLFMHSDGTLFTGSFFHSIYRSTDNGNNWLQKNSGITNQQITTIKTNSTNKIFAGTDQGIFLSLNYGESWTRVSYNEMNSKCNSLVINYNDDIFAAMDGAVYLSQDLGETWTNKTEALPRTTYSCIAIDSSYNIWVGNFGNLYFSSDYGNTWNNANIAPNIDYTSIVVSKNRDIFLSTTTSGVFRYKDGGTTWEHLGLSGIFINCLFVNNAGDIFAGTTFKGIYRSTDNGDSWQQLNLGLVEPSVTSIIQNSNGVLIAGTEVYGIFYSYDNGGTWFSLNEELFDTYIETLALTKDDYIFAGTLGGNIFRSTLAGTVPVELVSLSALQRGNRIILNWETATEKNNFGFDIEKFFSKNDIIKQWNKIGFIPGNGTVSEKKSYSYIDANITPGTSVYRIKQIDYNGSFTYSEEVKVENIQPFEFVLGQNYPNPFNPQTTIDYSLAVAGRVELNIYNVSGELVKTLVNNDMNPGQYSITWDGKNSSGQNASSGVYFYKLNAPSFTTTKTMLLLK